MDAVMYLVFLLPVALCQSHMVSEQCETDSCISKVVCLFQERTENMQADFNSTIERMQKELQKKEQELQDTKTQLANVQNELKNMTQRMSEVERDTCRPIQETPEVTVDYSTLHQNNYQVVDSVRVEGAAWRLRAQGTELWCTTWTTLEVYSRDLSLLRSVPLEGVRWASAVTPLPSGRLVVAEGRWNRTGGLHVLHPNGSRIQSLHTEGWFFDVVSVQGSVHALRDGYPTYGSHSTVYRYSITDGVLQYSGNITLPHRAQRISVFNGSLYLSDGSFDQVYQYTPSGRLLGRHGQSSGSGRRRGTSQPGQLRPPFLCSVDQKGNVLVADRGNYRLQVWFPREDRWRVTTLAGNSGWPYDAVVSGDGTTIWVLEKKDEYPYHDHIVKYTKQ